MAKARLRLNHRHVVGRVGRDDHDFKHDFPRKLQRIFQNPHLVRHKRRRRADHARNVALVARKFDPSLKLRILFHTRRHAVDADGLRLIFHAKRLLHFIGISSAFS